MSLTDIFKVVCAGLSVAGCAADGPAPVAVREFVCDDGSAGRVTWSTDQAEVTFKGKTWTLPVAMSASGARYADGADEIWEHQGTLRLTVDGAEPRHCTFTGAR